MSIRTPLVRAVSRIRALSSKTGPSSHSEPSAHTEQASASFEASAEERPTISLPPRDRVLDRLDWEGVLTNEQHNEAIQIWGSLPESDREPLWRIVARLDGVDSDRVFELAASTYGFSPLKISLIGSIALMNELGDVWPDSAWTRLSGLGAVPVVVEDHKPEELERLTIAAFDPVRTELRQLVADMTEGPFRMGFLARHHVDAVYSEASRILPHLIPHSIRRLGSVAPSVLRRAA